MKTWWAHIRHKLLAATQKNTASPPIPPPQPPPATPTPPVEKGLPFWLAIAGLGVGVIAAAIAGVTLIYMVVSDVQKAETEGPLIAVYADGAREIKWEESGEEVASLYYDIVVLSNYGRTDVDVLKLSPIGEDDVPIVSRIFLAADSCSNPGRVTIPAGGTAVIVGVPDVRLRAAQYFEVRLATRKDPFRVTREGLDADPDRVTTAFESEAETTLKACAPELFPPDL